MQNLSKACIELIFWFPLVLLFKLNFPSHSLWMLALLFMLLYIAGAYSCRLKWINRRFIPRNTLLIILSGVASYYFVGWNASGWVSWLGGFFIVYRGNKFSYEKWLRIFQPEFFFASLLAYFIESVLIHLQPSHNEHYITLLTILGLCTIFIYFYTANQLSLYHAAVSKNDKSGLPPSILALNRIWLLLLSLVILLFSFIAQIKSAIYQLIALIAHFILKVIKALSYHKGAHQTPAPTNSAMPTPAPHPVAHAKPSWFGLFMDQLFFILGVLMLAALALYILYRLFKLVMLIIAKIRKLHFVDEQSGYEDEEEQLLTLQKLPGMFKKSMTHLFIRANQPELAWERLTSNQERIRFLYRYLLKRAKQQGCEIKLNLTPSELDVELETIHNTDPAMRHALIGLYNEARYREHDSNSVEAIRLIEALRAVWKVK